MRLFVLFGSLLVMALIAALVVPFFVDWNQFRTRFEQEASRALGQKVEVKGETVAHFLPLPSLTFTNIHVGETRDGTPLLRAKSFKMNIELAPLLKGDVVVVDMELQRPRLDLWVDKTGKVEWPGEAGENRFDISFRDIALEKVVISQGVIRLRDERVGREIILKDIDANVSAKSLAGPWQGDGVFGYENSRVRVFGSTGLWQDTDQIRLKLTVQPQSQPYDFLFDGPLSLKDAITSFKGRMRIKPMLKQTDEELIEFRRPALLDALPIVVEADLEANASLLNIPVFKLDIGPRDDPYILTGTGQVDLSEAVSFRVRAEGQQLNVEQLSAASGETSSPSKNTSLAGRFAILRTVLERVPRFEADGEISLFLPAIVAGDTVIREVGMDLRPAEDGLGWKIANFEAQLPGRTDLRANGILSLGKEFGYEGDLTVASRQPSGLAAWLGAEVSATIRELPRVGFSAKTKITDKKAVFNDLEIAFGANTLNGALERLAIDPAQSISRPKLTAKLKGDNVNLDQLMALFGVFTGENGARTIGAHDFTLDLAAERLIASGVEVENVTAKMSYQNSKLAIEQLVVENIAGAKLSLAGTLDDFPAKPLGKLKGSLVSNNLSNFLSVVKSRGGDWAGLDHLIEDSSLVENTDLKFELSGQETGFRAEVKGKSGGSDVDFYLIGDGRDFAKPLTAQKLETGLILVNDDATRLMLQIGVPVVPLPGTGRAALKFNASGALKEGMKTDVVLTMRDGYLSASGLISANAIPPRDGFSGSLKLVSDIQDFDPLILLSGLALPGFGEGYSGKFSGQLKMNGGIYTLEELKAKIGDTDLSGKIALDTGAKPRPVISGTLNASAIELSSLAGLVYTNGSNSSEANVESRPVFAGFDAALSLSAGKVFLPETQSFLKKMGTLIVMRDGDITLDNLKANWLGGNITGKLSFAQTTNVRLLNGQMSLKGAELGAIANAAGFDGLFSGKIDVNGSFESSGKNSAALLSELTGSGSAVTSGGKVNGINENAFSALLLAADALKSDQTEIEAGELLKNSFYSGSLSFKPSELVFNMGGGVVRANNVKLANQNTELSGNARYDVIEGRAELDARIMFAAGKEAVIGAAPEFFLQFEGKPGAMKKTQDAGLFSTYLGMRLNERRQRDFESQQAQILERQRLQRTARLYVLKEEAERIAAIELKRKIELEHERQELLDKENLRLDQEIKAAEKQVALEKQVEAEKRARRQKQVDELRQRAEEAVRRLQENSTDEEITIEPEG